jgi:hypothetical protein
MALPRFRYGLLWVSILSFLMGSYIGTLITLSLTPSFLRDEEIGGIVTSTATSTATSTNTTAHYSSKYVPSSSEKYVVDHAKELGYASDKQPPGCDIWKGNIDSKNASAASAGTKELRSDLHSYQTDIDHHTEAIKEFKAIPDLMKSLFKSSKDVDKGGAASYTNSHRDAICAAARPHPDGLQALFPSHQLSFTPTSGYVEPLLPPMRDSRICNAPPKSAESATLHEFTKYLMSLDYLVHDFEYMCRQLKPTSKRILIDMGASLSFSHGENQVLPPIVELLNLYEKFGFHFDHIYGFESTFTKPQRVYENLLPEKYFHNYHWINVGVNHEEGHKLNPLHSILSQFDEDDFIVVKLDIDAARVELPLAHQLLEGGKDGLYHKLIDQFYFEQHVNLAELRFNWQQSMKGTIKGSLDLFHGLREKGIPAHFWV